MIEDMKLRALAPRTQARYLHAIKALSAAGVDLLTNPDLIKVSWEDFEKQKKGKIYKSLNKLEKPPGGELLPDERHHYECCIHAAMEHFGIDDEHQR